jgi:hypothetical protein
MDLVQRYSHEWIVCILGKHAEYITYFSPLSRNLRLKAFTINRYALVTGDGETHCYHSTTAFTVLAPPEIQLSKRLGG